MTTLVTFNGRFGDLLWALPTLRCLADAAGSPVDLLVGEEFDSLCPLIEAQPYIGAARAIEHWTMQTKKPEVGGRYDTVLHLSYPEWPTTLLPRYTYETAVAQWKGTLPPLDLDTPWITVPDAQGVPIVPSYIATCWTEEWIELKMGVTVSVANALLPTPPGHPPYQFLLHSLGGRHAEFDQLQKLPCVQFWQQSDWIKCAQTINQASCYLGCLSALWVLANAVGQRTVIVEPSHARLNPIFYYEHPRNHMVLGGDGKPTFHALHVAETLKGVLDNVR